MSAKSEFFENVLRSVSKATGEAVEDLRKLPASEVEKLHDEFIVGGALKEKAAKTAPAMSSDSSLFEQMKEKGYALPKKEEPSFDFQEGSESFAAPKPESPKLPKLELPEAASAVPSESDAEYVSRVNKMPLAAKIGGAAALGGAGYGAYKLTGGKKDEAAGSAQLASSAPAPISADDIPKEDKSLSKIRRGLEIAPSKLKPADFNAMNEDIKSKVPDIPSIDRKEFNDAHKEIKDKIQEAAKLYSDKAKTAEWAEVAETIGQALAQLGAASQGLSTGVDMSGLKFNKTDWKSKLDRYSTELDRSLRQLGAETEAVSKKEDAATKSQERKQEDSNKLREQLLALQARDKSSLRELEEEGRQKQASRENQLEVAKIGAESREDVAKTRSAAHTGQQGNTSQDARDTLMNMLETTDGQPKAKREVVQANLPALFTKADLTPAEYKEVQEVIDKSSTFGKNYKAGADKLREIVQRKAKVSPGTSSEAPHGQRVEQGGKVFVWDASQGKYVEER